MIEGNPLFLTGAHHVLDLISEHLKDFTTKEIDDIKSKLLRIFGKIDTVERFNEAFTSIKDCLKEWQEKNKKTINSGQKRPEAHAVMLSAVDNLFTWMQSPPNSCILEQFYSEEIRSKITTILKKIHDLQIDKSQEGSRPMVCTRKPSSVRVVVGA